MDIKAALKLPVQAPQTITEDMFNQRVLEWAQAQIAAHMSQVSDPLFQHIFSLHDNALYNIFHPLGFGYDIPGRLRLVNYLAHTLYDDGDTSFVRAVVRINIELPGTTVSFDTTEYFCVNGWYTELSDETIKNIALKHHSQSSISTYELVNYRAVPISLPLFDAIRQYLAFMKSAPVDSMYHGWVDKANRFYDRYIVCRPKNKLKLRLFKPSAL